ncbi:MAG TPA: L,D-transpeptidase family protein [Sedimentisphaerales bacterium]|nr:L,D-transpeptidase family protein [Sedimentisphaerales bacterium]
MARYPSSLYSKRRNQTRKSIYIISAVLIAAAVIAFIYGSHPFGRNKDQPVDNETETNITDVQEEKGGSPAVEEESKLKPEPEPAPKPEAKPEAKPELKPEAKPEVPTGSDSSTITPASNAQMNAQAAKLIDEALALLNANPPGIIKSRNLLNDVLPMPMSGQQREFVKKQLSWLADKWLFSRSVFPEDMLCGTYKVQPGDQLRAVGVQSKVPYEILMRINNIARPEALQAGEAIKVINGPFNVRVYRSTFTMDLYLQDAFVRSYTVGLGKPGMETPTGLWLVKPGGKLIKPPWTDPITGKTYHPDAPDYPLGSRWIGLEGIEGEAKGRTGFAIHGTKKPEEIGTAGSQGCIRMYNGEVELMYDLLMPGFSHVQVVE